MKSNKIKQLEERVDRLEILLDLYTMSLLNVIKSQNMENDLMSGKWYQEKIN